MGITIRRNSVKVKSNPFYSFDEITGFFGIHKSGNERNTRTIYTDGNPEEEARKLFEQFTVGGTIKENVKGHMWSCILEDGTCVTLRVDYPPGHAPAVQLSMRKSKDPAGIKSQKIHFEKRGKQ